MLTGDTYPLDGSYFRDYKSAKGTGVYFTVKRGVVLCGENAKHYCPVSTRESDNNRLLPSHFLSLACIFVAIGRQDARYVYLTCVSRQFNIYQLYTHMVSLAAQSITPTSTLAT